MTGEPVDWPTRDPVAHRVAATPQRTALIDIETGAAWSFRELDRRVDRAASGLVAATEQDDRARIGVLMDTRPAFATLFFAAMRIGATAVPLNVRETAGELASKVDRTDLTAIVCEADTEETALEIAADPAVVVRSVDDPTADRTEPLIPSERKGGPGPGSRFDLESESALEPQPESESRSVDPVALEREDTQLIMFTSGTSGEPKAVRLTVGNLVASATASAFRLGVDPSDRWLCCLPMYHMGGLAPVIRSVLYGTTVVIQREFGPESTARALAEHDATGVSLVPTMCKRLLDAGWEPTDALRFVLLGGAPASDDLLERCRDAGVPVSPTYGMTETASQIATATPAETAAHEGTVGQPLLFTDVSILEDGEPVAPGEPGDLVVSGPTVTPGYLDEEATAAAFGARGLHTGDIGYRDSDGRLWILNRRSDRIVTGGENVDPGEVVAALESHPRVDAAAVVGLADEEWGERVAALVVPDSEPNSSNGGSLEPRSLRAHCDDRLAGFKCPKTIAIADALPRTASGTVDRDAVRERLLENGTDVTESS
ncbi:class I adenylate-forming enzyme family protein [Natrinema versiforme]|uniref:O-succinylbenzoate--CoA ligase n=1 Tax=Natrinema versiforme JCM 10478 TaxID=1227496 RepID=L9Y6C7_9EURY|nr:class I adenylate-forming enzyme family protein [Natrinema versiforme]ELY69287.1 o-succinylbenzoate--CoA ligase [Natrinema versiforme JCM 10478]